MVEQGACGLKVWKDLRTSLEIQMRVVRVRRPAARADVREAANWVCRLCFTSPIRTRFFLAVDEYNERYEELAAHPEWSFYGSQFGKEGFCGSAIACLDAIPTRVRRPRVAERPESFAYVSEC